MSDKPADHAGDSRAEVEIVMAMVRQLDAAGKAELRRNLYLHLHPPPTARECHEEELGALARLLRTHGKTPPQGGDHPEVETLKEKSGALPPRDTWPRVERVLYDELRPSSAPPSDVLLQRNRTSNWALICKLAAALPLSDGQPLLKGAFWPHPGRGREGPNSQAPYTQEDAITAIRQCANELKRPLRKMSAQSYIEWSKEKRRRAERSHQEAPRLPCYLTIRRRLFTMGWAHATEAAKCADDRAHRA